MRIKHFGLNPLQTVSFSGIDGFRKVLLSFPLNYMCMSELTINDAIPKETFKDSLSSRNLFSFIILIDLLLMLWCFILSSESEWVSYLEEDVFFLLIFIGIGAIYILIKEIILVALYVYGIRVGRLTPDAQDEYNYRSICAVCLGWGIFDFLYPMMTEHLWLFNVSHMFFAFCGLLACMRILISLYTECFYTKPLKYDELNEFYYENEKIS